MIAAGAQHPTTTTSFKTLTSRRWERLEAGGGAGGGWSSSSRPASQQQQPPNPGVGVGKTTTSSDGSSGRRGFGYGARALLRSACARWTAGLGGAALVALGLLLVLLDSDALFAAEMDPRLVKALPDAPGACTADLRHRIAWGVGSSAYQIEGAWDEGGKAPSIWDTWAHTPGKVQNGDTGDVAADHYHRYREDIRMMAALGVKHYRLSLSWPRILPGGGRGTHVNKEGVAFYAALLKDLKAAGITPVVTLYHWDLPQSLQDMYGGFLDPQLADDFAYYADTVFRELGHLVRHWITFNEPMSICQLGYGIGVFAPGVEAGTAGQYKCGHHLLLAHGKAVQLYRGKYQRQQQGRISLSISGHWGRPASENSEADAAAAEAYVQFQIGWMADPIYTGDYPPLMRETQKNLPKFTAEQKSIVMGSVDFFALNFYTAHFVRAPAAGAPKAQLYEEMLQDAQGNPPGAASDAFWLFDTPWAMRKMLAWVSRRYGRPEIWVTENGAPAPGEAARGLGEALKDTFRLEYFSGYLDGACRAVAGDGVNLSAYFAWSLLDGLEWNEGFRPRFGLVHVNGRGGGAGRAAPARPSLRRYPKLSAYWLAHHFFRRAPAEIACLEIKSCGGMGHVRRLAGRASPEES